jgi:hypothetical protein
MCTVYEFPMKKELPENLEEGLKRFAREYVEMINSFYGEIEDDCSTEEGMNEIMRLISDTLMSEVALAIYELDL